MKNAFKKAKKAVSKAGQHIRWSSSESGSGSASRHAASERMSISTEEPEEFQTSSTHRPILILDSQLVPRGQDEAKALKSLNQKTYALTKCFDEDFLVDTSMQEEFNEVFQAIGWSDFAEIPEGGIILLTKEFLMTLRTDTRRDEPGRNSVSGVMTRAQRRRAEEQIRKANEDAQQPGAAPAWAHPSTPAWEANPQGSWHSSWNSIVPSVDLTPSHHSKGEYSYGQGAGLSHFARYTGGELDGNFTALFWALDLQEHRTLGMMDSLADIQQQQGVDHNLILETRATVDRMHEQSLMYYNWKGWSIKSNASDPFRTLHPPKVSKYFS
ncbi:hypothetical protein U9M48_024320 [Paspalum notatum var. saurae]|uniref:Uncharacterized protein n=1 Tax=Paspalum notatum var. saurae TaxID=547442 RepID=A0AAQ3TSP9_PASNO